MIRWLAQYNKAFVPLIMAFIYFLNAHYGIEIPLDETQVMIIFGVITSFITWLVPNKSMEK
jgi:hypothetical protein